jgi:hypothetical protein
VRFSHPQPKRPRQASPSTWPTDGADVASAGCLSGAPAQASGIALTDFDGAVIYGEQRIRYGELEWRVKPVGLGARGADVERGERAGIPGVEKSGVAGRARRDPAADAVLVAITRALIARRCASRRVARERGRVRGRLSRPRIRSTAATGRRSKSTSRAHLTSGC